MQTSKVRKFVFATIMQVANDASTDNTSLYSALYKLTLLERNVCPSPNICTLIEGVLGSPH